jgi:hypothetical protein
VSNFEAAFTSTSDQVLQVTAVTEHSTPASISSVPQTADAEVCRFSLLIGALGRELAIVDSSASTATPTMGGSIQLSVEARSAAPITYSWAFNGITIAGENEPTLMLSNLGLGDDGHYTVTAFDGTDSVQQTFTVSSGETFVAWIARRLPAGESLDGPDDDPDGDGATNKSEYLHDTGPADSEDVPAGILEPRPTAASAVLNFFINAKAADCDYVIEYTDDLNTWYNVTEFFAVSNSSPGVTRLFFLAPQSMDVDNAYLFLEYGYPFSGRGFYRLRAL